MFEIIILNIAPVMHDCNKINKETKRILDMIMLFKTIMTCFFLLGTVKSSTSRLADMDYVKLLNLYRANFETPDGKYIPIFTDHETIRCDESHFEVVGPLGSGTRSSVSQVKYLFTGEQYAIKYFDPKYSSWDAVRAEEVILHKLRHQYLPRGICTFSTSDGKTAMVMTLARGGTLENWAKQRDNVTRGALQRIAQQMIDVLEYLHSHGIIHNDIKPENIGMQESGDILLLDFDRSVYAMGLLPSQRGTPLYMALEKVLGHPYDNGVDWYAFGMVLVVLYLGKHPYENATDFIKLAEYIQLGFDELDDPDLDDLVTRLCELEVPKRWSHANGNVKELQSHPFVTAK